MPAEFAGVGPRPPVLVAGMHRSGTSLVGGLLSALGVDMGSRLVPADRRNARGYFEDVDVVELHGRMFRALLPAHCAGHADWGWSEAGLVSAEDLSPFEDAARTLVAARREACPSDRPWGFKDPRTTVSLSLWQRVLPEARFVLVYRFPWEVADSMQRVGAEVFLRNPSYGYRIWAAYNARLLDFHARHRERCILVSANALPSALQRLPALLAQRGVQTGAADLTTAFSRELFTSSDADDRRADLVAAAYPECSELLERLDEAADLPATGRWRRDAPARTAIPGPGTSPAPVVSIVIPTHDDGVLLLDALASVERHAPPGTELVVVDDGSTDPESRRIVQALRGRGYHVLSKPGAGLSSARNAGIALARGRYVLPLDADNRLCAGFVEEAVAALDAAPGLSVVYGDRRLFGALDGVVRVPEFDLEKLVAGNYLDACALYRRELWSEVDGYDTAMIGLEDWDFWLKAGAQGRRFLRLERVAFDYRIRPGSLLTLTLSRPVKRRLFEHLLRKHADLFHARVPGPMRLPSSLLARLHPASAARVARLESRAFWRPLWALVGPGGLFARDRTLRRAKLRALG